MSKELKIPKKYSNHEKINVEFNVNVGPYGKNCYAERGKQYEALLLKDKSIVVPSVGFMLITEHDNKTSEIYKVCQKN